MLFGKKLKLMKKPDEDAERRLREELEKEGGLEKNDLPALIISAILVIVPIALIALLLVCLVGWLFFI